MRLLINFFLSISLTLCRFIFAKGNSTRGKNNERAEGVALATGGGCHIKQEFPYLSPLLTRKNIFSSSPARITKYAGGDNKKYLPGVCTRFGFIKSASQRDIILVRCYSALKSCAGKFTVFLHPYFFARIFFFILTVYSRVVHIQNGT